ncbi:hypothetical protein RUM44_013651 [Polyplax serrata]|uniref:Uncharacterized protein n=1 Tax=Polyplax serrata TaxID=468196 RepID=A0ABR1BID3_POLSC
MFESRTCARDNIEIFLKRKKVSERVERDRKRERERVQVETAAPAAERGTTVDSHPVGLVILSGSYVCPYGFCGAVLSFAMLDVTDLILDPTRVGMEVLEDLFAKVCCFNAGNGFKSVVAEGPPGLFHSRGIQKRLEESGERLKTLESSGVAERAFYLWPPPF